MRQIFKILFVSAILLVGYTFSYADWGSRFSHDIRVSVHKQPSMLDKNVEVVLDQSYIAMFNSSASLILIPRISFIDPFYMPSLKEQESINPEAEPVTTVESGVAIPPSLMEFAKEVSVPISDYIENEYDEYGGVQNYLYADVFAMLLSYMVRQFTANQLDILLLTDHDNPENRVQVDGIELGIRPDPLLGFRVRVKDNETQKDYGMEVHFYPSEDTALKLIRSTEKTTELELNMKF